MKLTIDANVFVSAAITTEPQHAVSLQFLKQVRVTAPELFCPVLLLPEASASISRPTGNLAMAAALVAQIEQWPGLQLIQITLARAQRAAAIAITERLKGADAIYAAIAEEFAASLVTWDKELLQRGPGVVATLTPADWLKANPAPPSTPGQP